MSNAHIIVPEKRVIWHVDAGSMTDLFPHPLRILGWIHGETGDDLYSSDGSRVITDHGIRFPGSSTFVGTDYFFSWEEAHAASVIEAEHFLDTVGKEKAESSRKRGCSCHIPSVKAV